MSTAAKRIPIVLSILLAAMLAAALAPQPALAEGAQVIASGPCGGCTWTLDEGGLLTIAPTEGEDGVLPSNNGGRSGFWPWSANPDGVKSISISEGVKAGESAAWMFAGCRYLASADLSNLDVSGTRSLETMFMGCWSLESLDLSSWNVSSVENMEYMFNCCTSLESLDLSGWDASSCPVDNMFGMFQDCQFLAELKLGAKMRLRNLPDNEVNGRSDWYSPDAKRWFSSADELNDYLKSLPVGAVCTLTKGTSIAGAEWSGVEGRTYTGEEQTQDPTLTLGGVALERGTHYELSYEGNVAAGTATVIATGTGAGGYVGTASRTFTIARAKVAVPKAKSGLVYNGKSQTGVPAGAGYTVKGGQATKAGSHTATLTADANHVFSTGKATAAVAWKIAKANGAVAIKARSSKPVAIAAGKSVLATKALKVTKNASKGKVTYKKVKGDKRIAVKSGKITVKKGLKKGTYTIKVKAVSAATANYKAATSKAIALKVKVK